MQCLRHKKKGKSLNYSVLVQHMNTGSTNTKKPCDHVVTGFLLGADDGNRTHTVSHTPLKRARLPVPPHPHLISCCEELNSKGNYTYAATRCQATSEKFQKRFACLAWQGDSFRDHIFVRYRTNAKRAIPASIAIATRRAEIGALPPTLPVCPLTTN